MIVGKVGYLGPKATFTHVAVQGVFKQHDTIFHTKQFQHALMQWITEKLSMELYR